MRHPATRFWPDDADAPPGSPRREQTTYAADDGLPLRATWWLPPHGEAARPTTVVLAHPRLDFSVHYAAPLLAAAGYRVLAAASRYTPSEPDFRHDVAASDASVAIALARADGVEAVALLGNSGGGALLARAQVAAASPDRQADAFVALAAHPGEAVYLEQVLDPSVIDEDDPFTTDPDLDMFNPTNGWRPWPEPSAYDPAWLDAYRAAQRARVARIDARVAVASADRGEAVEQMQSVAPRSSAWFDARRRAAHLPYFAVYRTLADPAHLDPSIDPDDRPLGSIFAFPDPLDANAGPAGLARVCTSRAWRSTWSSSTAAGALETSLAAVEVPTLIVHPTGDTEVRMRQATALADASAATDRTMMTLAGATHYLEGRRTEALDCIVDWLRARLP